LIAPWNLCQGDYIAYNENTLTKEHGEESGEDSVLFELLLLEEDQEALLTHEMAIAHSIELEVNEEGNPFDCKSCSVVSIGPFVESFILNDLCLI
jgi:hypothetical protein